MGEVIDYIAGLDEPARSLIERFRQRAVAVVPEAAEGMSYGMAAVRYHGRPLVSVIRTKQGYTVFPFSPAVVASVVAEFDCPTRRSTPSWHGGATRSTPRCPAPAPAPALALAAAERGRP